MIKKLSAVKFFIIAVILAVMASATDQKKLYVESCGDDISRFSYHETIEKDGIKITLTRESITEICIVDSNYYCLKWI